MFLFIKVLTIILCSHQWSFTQRIQRLVSTCLAKLMASKIYTLRSFLSSNRLYSPWNSPGQNTGVGSLSLFQGIFPNQGSNPGLPHCRWILYQLSHQMIRWYVIDRLPSIYEHWGFPKVHFIKSIVRNLGRVFGETFWCVVGYKNSV